MSHVSQRCGIDLNDLRETQSGDLGGFPRATLKTARGERYNAKVLQL